MLSASAMIAVAAGTATDCPAAAFPLTQLSNFLAKAVPRLDVRDSQQLQTLFACRVTKIAQAAAFQSRQSVCIWPINRF